MTTTRRKRRSLRELEWNDRRSINTVGTLFFTVRKREWEVCEICAVRNQDSDHHCVASRCYHCCYDHTTTDQTASFLSIGLGRLFFLWRNYFNEGTFQQEQQQPSSLPSKEDRTLTKIKQKTKRDKVD